MYKQALLNITMTGAAMPNKNAMSVRFSAESKLKTESSLWQSFSSYKSLNSLCSRNNAIWKSIFFSFLCTRLQNGQRQEDAGGCFS